MGITSVKLVVAQLLHCFNWELPNCMFYNELDMLEKFELTIPRSQPLLALPTYRLAV
ncbi:hypothetical protein MtrunA17_Chr6g0484761 [Medicago truncatula]|uniref:Cytochrome P450 n=1 Tax=Medicago truncatula TaxID=3880 RepID=A0A396HHL7_MEDTR|nr:hypothetical protein MtrunA17_Chr6g0484761 [Medicago truncatula]